VKNHSRRDFLQTVITSAAMLGAPTAFAQAAQSTKPKIKAGFLGVAHSHALAKWKLVQNSPDFDLVGLVEDAPALRSQYQALGAKLLSLDQLFAGADVILVESAVRDHARHAKLALSAGKHVHCEKPPSVTMDDFNELVSLARRHNRILQPGYMWRHHPGFAAIFEAVRKTWLGDIYLVRGTINTSVAAERRPEWAEFKGGTMFELGCHLIDPLVRLLGRPRRVKPTLRSDARANDGLNDNTLAVFEFDRAMGIVTSSTQQPNAFPYRAFEVFGTNGTAVLRPIEPATLQIDLAKPAGPYKAGSQTVEVPKYDRYVGDIAELAAVTRSERPLSVTLDDELLVHDALLKACDMN
jgi:predicted dehydrogenase